MSSAKSKPRDKDNDEWRELRKMLSELGAIELGLLRDTGRLELVPHPHDKRNVHPPHSTVQ